MTSSQHAVNSSEKVVKIMVFHISSDEFAVSVTSALTEISTTVSMVSTSSDSSSSGGSFGGGDAGSGGGAGGW